MTVKTETVRSSTSTTQQVRPGQPTDSPGALRRAFRRIAADQNEREDAELADHSAAIGASPIVTCGDRRVVTVCGRIKSTTLRPRSGAPSVEAELWDGSGALTLVWLGRRSLAGVGPGQRLRVTGRVCCTDDDRRTLYNPRYELLPPD